MFQLWAPSSIKQFLKYFEVIIFLIYTWIYNLICILVKARLRNAALHQEERSSNSYEQINHPSDTSWHVAMQICNRSPIPIHRIRWSVLALSSEAGKTHMKWCYIYSLMVLIIITRLTLESNILLGWYINFTLWNTWNFKWEQMQDIFLYMPKSLSLGLQHHWTLVLVNIMISFQILTLNLIFYFSS